MIPQELPKIREITEAVGALKETSYSMEELEKSERYWDILRTQQSIFNDAIREGEHEQAKFSAGKLLIRGLSNEDIADITGLEIEEIAAIRKEIN